MAIDSSFFAICHTKTVVQYFASGTDIAVYGVYMKLASVTTERPASTTVSDIDNFNSPVL